MSSAWREQAAQLARRRGALVAEGQVQRAAIASAWVGLEPPLHWLQVAVRVAHYVRTRPWTVALPLLGVGLLAPRRLGRLVVTLMSVIRLWSAFRR